jgi:hypothetical protein
VLSKPVKTGIHKHAGFLLHWPMTYRHTKLTLQRPAISPQLKASTQRPMGHNPPSTWHRKAPNLSKRNTQRGLDTKELTSEQLTQQFYCSRTGDFFLIFNFYFLPFFKGFAAWFTVLSFTISTIFFLF